MRPHVITCGGVLEDVAACYNVRLHVRYYNVRPHIITCRRTLIHAAACCKMRPHVITLTEGPIQPRYLSFKNSLYKEKCGIFTS